MTKRDTQTRENSDFGARVRVKREAIGLTLEQFALKSGISRAMLSKVERGEKTPTIGVAKSISHALDTSLSALIADQAPTASYSLVRHSERHIFKDPETGFERHLLSPIVPGLAVEVVMHVLPPRRSTGRMPFMPGTAKHIVALSGKLIVGFDNQKIALGEGDSLYIEAKCEHWFENPTDSTAQYYVIISSSPG